MAFQTEEDNLRFDIACALKSHGYAPPRTRDASLRDAYFDRVAVHVVEHLARMWKFERKPLAPPHAIGLPKE